MPLTCSWLTTIVASGDALSRYLQREGYRVTTAKDASDARVKLDGPCLRSSDS